MDGDAVMAMCATRMARDGELRNATVVATVMSNLGLERALKSQGLSLVRTPVGDRYVVEAMRQGGFNLGGEQSGHLIFLDHASTGDGLIGALQVLALMMRTGRPLSELAQQGDGARPPGARERDPALAPAARGDARARADHGARQGRRSAPTVACSCAGAAPSPSSASCSKARTSTGSGPGPRSSARRRGRTWRLPEPLRRPHAVVRLSRACRGRRRRCPAPRSRRDRTGTTSGPGCTGSGRSRSCRRTG